jgi:hypothetical protein
MLRDVFAQVEMPGFEPGSEGFEPARLQA